MAETGVIPLRRSTRTRRAYQGVGAAGATVPVHHLTGLGRNPRGSACKQCNHLRVVCSGTYPCTRCWRLALPCRLQGQAEADNEAAAADPLLELAFTRNTPEPYAELMMQAFMDLHKAGRVSREKALGILYARNWVDRGGGN